MRTFAQKPKAPQQATTAKPTIPGWAHFGQSHEVNSILHLQRMIGNQIVQRLVQANAEELNTGSATTASTPFGHDFSRIRVHPPTAGSIQTKLVINKPGDEYEQEADRVSEQVMRMPEPQQQRACPCGGGCPKCQTKQPGQEHERFQTKRIGASELGQPAAPPMVNEVLASPGQPLDLAKRAFFEPRFGYDFSRVRVHTDGQAAQSAGDVKARAYTVGQHVVFGAGEYAPGTNAGNSLIAHELVHTVQQRTDVVRPQDDAFTTWVQRTPAASAASKTETGTAPATQGSTFDPSCNGVQQELVGLVLQRTKLMVDRAVVRMLLLWMDESGGSDRDYLHWFGTFDKGRARHVLRTYQLISSALERGIELACDCDRQIYAYVFPGLKRKIHLCALFWSAPFSGLDSKPGVIVHELSHEVLRGGDFRYSIAKAERLAVYFPWLAVRNADNYEYFAESL